MVWFYTVVWTVARLFFAYFGVSPRRLDRGQERADSWRACAFPAFSFFFLEASLRPDRDAGERGIGLIGCWCRYFRTARAPGWGVAKRRRCQARAGREARRRGRRPGPDVPKQGGWSGPPTRRTRRTPEEHREGRPGLQRDRTHRALRGAARAAPAPTSPEYPRLYALERADWDCQHELQ